MSNWTLFSNHGHVLVCLARDPESRLRDVAADVGITERAVQKIVRDLQEGGMISISKHGRRNRYKIDNTKNLRHNLEANCTLGALTGLIVKRAAVETTQVVSSSAEATPAEPVPVPARDAEPTENSAVSAKPEKPENADLVKRQQGSLF